MEIPVENELSADEINYQNKQTFLYIYCTYIISGFNFCKRMLCVPKVEEIYIFIIKMFNIILN